MRNILPACLTYTCPRLVLTGLLSQLLRDLLDHNRIKISLSIETIFGIRMNFSADDHASNLTEWSDSAFIRKARRKDLHSSRDFSLMDVRRSLYWLLLGFRLLNRRMSPGKKQLISRLAFHVCEHTV